MKYVVDDAIADKLGLTFPQILALMLIKTGEDIKWVLGELMDKQAIIQIGTPPTRYMLTQKWELLYNSVLSTPNKVISKEEEERIVSIAKKLMEIFPQGKKPGTPYYWKGNIREITLKLKSFFKLYGNTYTEKQIIDAARNYVESFNGDYRFMRLLKYFIWKREDNGTEVSELATFIDNAEQEDIDIGNNWVNELK